ncbi:MAG: hypothetical protein ACTSQJ_16020 [Promethearchaeota archaeon]
MRELKIKTTILSETERLKQEIAQVKEDIQAIEKKYAENVTTQENYIEIKAKLYQKLGELEGKLSLLKSE